MKENTPPAPSSRRTTAATHFGACNGIHAPVFAVNPDVEIDDVLMHLSAAVTSAFESNAQLCEMLARPLADVAWATWHSLEICQALIEGLRKGDTCMRAEA